MLRLSLTDQERLSCMFFFTLSPNSEGGMVKKQNMYKINHLAPGVEAVEVTESEGLPHEGVSNEGLPYQGVCNEGLPNQGGVPDEGLLQHLGRPLAPHPPDRLPLPLIWRDWHPSKNTHMLPTKAKSWSCQTGWLSLKLVLISKPAISDRQGQVGIQYLGGCAPTLFPFSSSWHQSHHSLPHSPWSKHTDQHIILLRVDCQHVMIAHLRNHLSSSFSQPNQGEPILGQNVDCPKLTPRVPNPSCCCCPSPSTSRDPPPVSEILTVASHNHLMLDLGSGNVKQGFLKHSGFSG